MMSALKKESGKENMEALFKLNPNSKRMNIIFNYDEGKIHLDWYPLFPLAESLLIYIQSGFAGCVNVILRNEESLKRLHVTATSY